MDPGPDVHAVEWWKGNSERFCNQKSGKVNPFLFSLPRRPAGVIERVSVRRSNLVKERAGQVDDREARELMGAQGNKRGEKQRWEAASW